VSRGRLLLVDDDDDIRAIARMSLTRIGGWEVVPAASADEAEAEARHAPPAVVLLDVMMPDVDGPATLERLRPLIGDAPVIFLTAKTQSSDLERLTSLGAVGVIAKPFDPMGLPEEVDALIGS
jgi:two-component system OmpR family response regulator